MRSTPWWSPEGLQAAATVLGIAGGLYLYLRYGRSREQRAEHAREFERANSVVVVAQVVPGGVRTGVINRSDVPIWNVEAEFVGLRPADPKMVNIGRDTAPRLDPHRDNVAFLGWVSPPIQSVYGRVTFAFHDGGPKWLQDSRGEVFSQKPFEPLPRRVRRRLRKQQNEEAEKRGNS